MTTRLPDIPIASARLPATYEAAKTALAECSRLDECQSWAGKAEALASYARQAKDEQLRKMADRIQARAIRRCGELLKQVEPQQGANQNIQDGTVPKVLSPCARRCLSYPRHRRPSDRGMSYPAPGAHRRLSDARHRRPPYPDERLSALHARAERSRPAIRTICTHRAYARAYCSARPGYTGVTWRRNPLPTPARHS